MGSTGMRWNHERIVKRSYNVKRSSNLCCYNHLFFLIFLTFWGFFKWNWKTFCLFKWKEFERREEFKN
jgi:hypothetical protein